MVVGPSHHLSDRFARMTSLDHWSYLDIHSPDAGGVAAPGPGVSVVAFLATPGARSEGWAPRAAVEIARAWSAEGTRIILCDAGFEEPSLHEAAGLDNLEGISDALLFGTSFQRLGQPLTDRLFLASAGTAVPDGEALRAHPRWRDFAKGFAEASALQVIYVPSDWPGADALLELCRGVLVLTRREESGAVALPSHLRLLGVFGPEAERDGPASDAEDQGVEEEAVGREDAEVEGPRGVGLPPGDGGVDDVNAPTVDVTERNLEAAEDGNAREEDGGLANGIPAAENPGESAPDPGAPEYSGTVEEGSPGSVVAADPVEAGSAPPEAGRRRLLLVVLLAVVVGLLVAGRFGLLDIPGITPSEGASVDDADAAEVAREANGESVDGPAESSLPSTPASASGGEPSTPPADGAAGAPESPVLTFALTLGSFEDLASAEARAAANRRAFPDLDFVIAPVEVEGRAWFRLLAGPAPDRAALDGVRERLAGAGRGGAGDWIVRRAPLAFLVAAHSSLPLARRNVQALGDAGIPSYVLVHRGEDGALRYRVYVGAYANAAEADYMARLLEENRIQDAQLTERRGVRP